MSKQAVDVGDEKQVKRAELLTELERRQELEAIRILLSMSGGRAFMRNILNFCGVDAMAPAEPVPMNRYEGRRDVGLFVRKECLTADPDGYSLIATEVEIAEVEILEDEGQHGS